MHRGTPAQSIVEYALPVISAALGEGAHDVLAKGKGFIRYNHMRNGGPTVAERTIQRDRQGPGILVKNLLAEGRCVEHACVIQPPELPDVHNQKVVVGVYKGHQHNAVKSLVVIVEGPGVWGRHNLNVFAV
jgi:hypothetical protein